MTAQPLVSWAIDADTGISEPGNQYLGEKRWDCVARDEMSCVTAAAWVRDSHNPALPRFCQQ